jgi:GcrA cell cycle regulator
MRCASDPFEWNDENVRRLKTLWAEGYSTAEIGRRMGGTKNAIVGKAHRLNLPTRPSPIRAEAERKPRQPRRAPRVTLPGAQQPPTRTKASHLTRLPPTPPALRAPEAMKLGVTRCCWPIGDPGTPEFRFCEATNAAGYPYCPDHCALAYRPAARRAAAA